MNEKRYITVDIEKIAFENITQLINEFAINTYGIPYTRIAIKGMGELEQARLFFERVGTLEELTDYLDGRLKNGMY